MKVLFIHPNFPAQFRHVASALGRQPHNRVVFLTANPRPEWEIPGVEKRLYTLPKPQPRPGEVPCAEFYGKLEKGRAVLDSLAALRQKDGFVPDLIVGHSGWGTTFFIKDIYPEVPFLGYFEWFYNLHGSNLDFDRQTPPSLNTALNARLRNTYIVNDLLACDRGICPTTWQLRQMPEMFREKITCLHEGIDTGYFRPGDQDGLELPGLDLRGVTKIITYAARGFEPYRGFPQFMEALALVQQREPDCHAVIVGSDRVCYGEARPDGKSFRQHLLETLDLDLSRVHFTGELPYGHYCKVLQNSACHVYLTYPFVLSWSLLEAMACGCRIVASDTPPVREVINDGENGVLAPFFSPQEIAAKIIGVLTYPSFVSSLGERARQSIEAKYSLKALLPKHIELLREVAGGTSQKAGPFG